MRVVDGIVTNALHLMTDFVFNDMLPWVWDNKLWIACAVPLIVIIAIAKWMWE